jgi:peroxiredoxin
MDMDYNSNLSEDSIMGVSNMPPTRGLPAGLPVPVDDGAAAHLVGRSLPQLSLASTSGGFVDLAELAAAALVLYVFPRIGRPDEPDPAGWKEIPGAYGCTQQSCAFRDLQHEFASLGYSVVGLSAQSSEEQGEAQRRLHLGFSLVADPDRRLGERLNLPTFSAAGRTLYRRLTLVATGGEIVKVIYPVFPPGRNAHQVLSWIRTSPTARRQ